MLTFEEIALLRRTLCDHFGLRLEFDRSNKGRGHMVAHGSTGGRSIADTEAAANLYNKLAEMHAEADA